VTVGNSSRHPRLFSGAQQPHGARGRNLRRRARVGPAVPSAFRSALGAAGLPASGRGGSG
jgi:hypothetical protein